MRAIQLHDKWTEEIIGTILLKPEVTFDEIESAWDEFQKYHGSNAEKPGDIFDFYNEYYGIGFEVLDVEFYQP